MGWFHKKLDHVMDPGLDAIGKEEILKEYIEEIRKEFNLDDNVREELAQYVRHLSKALSLIKDNRNRTPLVVNNGIKPHIDAATVLIRDIERKLRAEFKGAHKFLE